MDAETRRRAEDLGKEIWRAVSNRALRPARSLTSSEWEPTWRDRLSDAEREVWRIAGQVAVEAVARAVAERDAKLDEWQIRIFTDAEKIARLRAALNGTHFHHKAFEPECAHCQAALKEVTDGR